MTFSSVKIAIKRWLAKRGFHYVNVGNTSAQISLLVTSRFQDDAEEYCFLCDNPYDLIQRHHVAGELYEAEELAMIGRHLKPGAVVIDVGANVGNHSIAFAKRHGAAKVYAVEPGARQQLLLNANIRLNNAHSMIESLPFALSDEEGAACLGSPNESNLGASRIQAEGEEIALKRGDDVFADTNVDFIKIDAEGHEVAVLNGLSQTIRRCKPTLFIEADDGEMTQNWLARNGYRVVDSFTRYRGLVNVICVPA